jgi:hypothetical protein
MRTGAAAAPNNLGDVPRSALCAALIAVLALGGCSLKADDADTDIDSGDVSFGGAPVVGAEPDDERATEKLGFPFIATRNTTRVAGSDPVADAAGVASALFPATDEETQPPAIVLVDKDDWQGIVAASVLVSAPMRAPILLSDGDELPAVTAETIDRLKPKGASLARGAETILIGDRPPPPPNTKSAVIKGTDPYDTAVAIDRFSAVARGKPSPNVIIASGEKPEYAMPAAAWGARSGDAILFVKQNEIPEQTRSALEQHEKPRIFVLGPESVISSDVEKELGDLGRVERVGAEGPVENAIAFAGYNKGDFGWGPIAPGGNYTVASSTRPGDAAGAAGLGANGIFAPLLLTDAPRPLPRALENFFLDVQPGYYADTDPRDSVFNRVWILGGTDAIAADVQARLDTLVSLVPIEEPEQ